MKRCAHQGQNVSMVFVTEVRKCIASKVFAETVVLVRCAQWEVVESFALPTMTVKMEFVNMASAILKQTAPVILGRFVLTKNAFQMNAYVIVIATIIQFVFMENVCTTKSHVQEILHVLEIRCVRIMFVLWVHAIANSMKNVLKTTAPWKLGVLVVTIAPME